MRAWLSILVLCLAGLVVAQDATGPVVTPYGLAMYRFREEIIMKSGDNMADSSLTNYVNTVAYKFGSKIKLNDRVSFQFEIANDWNATEAVNLANWNYMGKRALTKGGQSFFPYLTLANVVFDAGSYHMSTGVIGLQSTAASALLAASLFQNRTYALASHLPWATVTSGGIPGFRLGAPVAKGDFKLGLDVTTSIVEERGVLYSGEDSTNSNNSAMLVNLDVPMSTGALTLCPQAFLVTDRNFRDAGSENEGDMEVIAGVEAGYKLSDVVSLRGGIGIGMISNLNTESADSAQYDRLGINGAVGTTIKAGPGKLDIDAAFSQATDAKDSSKDVTYPYFDLKYGYPLNKNFVVMPRVRLFITSTETYSINHIRPEMIFSGAF